MNSVTAMRTSTAVPPTALVIGAVASVQLGASLAKGLFDDVGPGGTVLLRMTFAALLLAAIWRPRARGRTRADWLLAAAFGLSLAGMNFAFYSALERIPLGVAVTLEFAGPLAVAVFGSRRPLDLLGRALAAPPDTSGRRRGITGDGRVELVLHAPPDGARATLRTPRGTFTGPDYLLDIRVLTGAEGLARAAGGSR